MTEPLVERGDHASLPGELVRQAQRLVMAVDVFDSLAGDDAMAAVIERAHLHLPVRAGDRRPRPGCRITPLLVAHRSECA